MPMYMIMREKRKEIGLTQEQIAEYLGVSTPAVNKWEKGSTYPDISLLPALARLLRVDLNTLLCFNEGLSKQEVDHFCNDIVDTIRKKDYDSGFAMGIEKIQEYPNCGLLIHTTALVLEGALRLYGTSVADKEFYEKKITALYERAAKSGDDRVQNTSIYMLALTYLNGMEFDKAQEMMDLLPERPDFDKKQLQGKLLKQQGKFTEAQEILEHELLDGVNKVQTTLMSLVDIELKTANYNDASHLAELYQNFSILFDLWGYNSYVALFELSVAQKNVQECIPLLKSMLAAMLIPWELQKSPLYRHIGFKEDQGNFGAQMLTSILSELENSPDYEFLHSNEEFQQLLEQYRAKC